MQSHVLVEGEGSVETAELVKLVGLVCCRVVGRGRGSQEGAERI